jgi:DNA repair protein RadD
MMIARDYQQKAVDSIYNYWSKNENKGNPVIAMPVGSGKSFTMALFIKSIFDKYGKYISKVMLLTHVKELIEQDYQAIIDYWEGAPIGIYSASMNSRDYKSKIVCAGIQSVAKKAELFGKVNVIVIDECHLVSPKDNTGYKVFISELKKVNPKLKVVGFSGSIFRLDCGYITGNGVFDDVCYNMCDIDSFNMLIDNKCLCNAIPKKTNFKIDVSEVKMRGGEYIEKELQKAVDTDIITEQALKEAVALAKDRKHWLIFCTGVEHAEHVSAYLNVIFGIKCCVIHGGLKKTERDTLIDEYKRGVYRACANVNVLSTGFNFPSIDCLIMLRPTQSITLWIQACGRGIRYSKDKENCLVLDFAGNTERLGCINDPRVPKEKSKNKSDQKGETPFKVCPECMTYNTTRATSCVNCGYEFPKIVKISTHASIEEIIRKRKESEVKKYNINKITYAKIKTKTGEQLLVTYLNGIQSIAKDWINMNASKDILRIFATQWIKERYACTEEEFKNIDLQKLLVLGLTKKLKEPISIEVKTTNGYNRITKYCWNNE